jgi:hypothetical protein
MIPLGNDAIRRLADPVLRQRAPGLRLAGISTPEGGHDRVELLLAADGPGEGAGLLSLNLPRSSAEAFTRELERRLAAATAGAGAAPVLR